MTSLVTGATGFIGARLVEELLQREETVHVLCRPTSDTSSLQKNRVVVFRGNLGSRVDVAAAMQGCDRVYHLAAFAGNWVRDEAEVRIANIDAVRTIFEVALERGIQRVVYTSTILIYGSSSGAAVTEDTVRSAKAKALYEQLKIDAEAEVEQALRSGLDIVVVHPTRVFGPGKLTEANSTTILVKQYLKGTWRTIPGNGDAVGNYVYVRDIVLGCIAAMERASKGRHFILGGSNLTYSELFELIAKAGGKRRFLLPVPRVLAKVFSCVELGFGRIGIRKPSITPAWVDIFYDDWLSSSDRAEREIGYTPTPIEDAITETIAWIRNGST